MIGAIKLFSSHFRSDLRPVNVGCLLGAKNRGRLVSPFSTFTCSLTSLTAFCKQTTRDFVAFCSSSKRFNIILKSNLMSSNSSLKSSLSFISQLKSSIVFEITPMFSLRSEMSFADLLSCSFSSHTSSLFISPCSFTSSMSFRMLDTSYSNDKRSKRRASISGDKAFTRPVCSKSCKSLEDDWASLSEENTDSFSKLLRRPNMVFTSVSESSWSGACVHLFRHLSCTSSNTFCFIGGTITGDHFNKFKRPEMSVVLASMTSVFRFPRVGMKTFAISHAPAGDPHCCLSLLFQKIFGRRDLWRRLSSFFHVAQVAHLDE